MIIIKSFVMKGGYFMKKNYKNEANYYYDPQLTDPRLNIYPRSAFDFQQERWVTPLCLLVKDSYLYSSFISNHINGI